MKNAIVLCSGGIDSVVTAHHIRRNKDYGSMIILFFNYGQKSLESEREFSMKCAEDLESKFLEIKVEGLEKLSGSLINVEGNVVEVDNLKDTKEESDKWYVPCRNTVFLSYALAVAESKFVKEKINSDIFVGFKNEGGEGFRDTTIEFVKKMNNISKEACASEFNIIAPLIARDKENIIMLGKYLEIDFKKTYSCYIGNGKHCGKCLACKLRKAGFYWADIIDPTEYLK
jgi:7-cyano-7-deazaguanine synthase